jgi:uncharacterized membrane protein YfcA
MAFQWIDLLLVIAVFIISFFSVISGGIGLLTRPLLIFFGYSPSISIGSFRVANLVTRVAGFIPLLQQEKSHMDWRLAWFLFIPSFIGGIIGAELVAILDEEMIKKVLGVFVIVMGIFLVVKKNIGLIDLEEEITPHKKIIGFFFTILIGIVAAFLGGSGILFAYLLIMLYHKSFISSATIRKITNFGSALSASIFFIFHADVDWRLVLLCSISGGLGEYLGARYQIPKGEKWVRVISIYVVFACGIAMLIF